MYALVNQSVQYVTATSWFAPIGWSFFGSSQLCKPMVYATTDLTQKHKT